MTIEVLRPMRPDSRGRPELGEASYKLGAREHDVVITEQGEVLPTTGVSIATSMTGVRNLPWFLLPWVENSHPLRLDPKKQQLRLFAYRAKEYEPFTLGSPISEGLSVVAKPDRKPDRGYIVPATRMSLSRYQDLLRCTHDKWQSIGWEATAAALSEMPDD